MLEYALRMERSKQLSQPASHSAPPTKLSTIQANTASSSQKDDSHSQKEDSGGSSPRSEDSPLPDSRLPNGGSSHGPTGRPNSWGTTNWTNIATTGTVAGLGKPPLGRDPKSRARSRDYLKQCLQEISYLTSPQAMNPLPNRPLLNNPSAPLSLPNVPSFDQIAYNGRPRKVLPEAGKEFPLLNGMNPNSGPPTAGTPSGGPQLSLLERNPHISSAMLHQPPPPLSKLTPQTSAQSQEPSSASTPQIDKDREIDSESRQLTAIFRDEAGEWKEKLRASHEAAEKLRQSREFQQGNPGEAGPWDRQREEDDDVKEDENDVEDEEASLVGEGEGSKLWKAKRTLRNHLDAVRALAFHPTELCLATGGDDCTVKIWRMDVANLASSASRATTEVEPQLTLRGHSAAITRLIHSPSKQLLYSASLDSSIRIWALPSPSHTTYAPYDETRSRGELVGHTDAVWDLALVRDESTLISCGAEGSWTLRWRFPRLTWGWHGVENPDDLHDNLDAPGATSVEAIKTDLKKVAVAYQNAIVKIFDIETGKELSRLESDMSYDGTPATQINRIVSHPTMSLLVTAHEDKFIRIFDLATGQCTHSMLAHLDGVTSLSIDAAGFSLVSGSHDCSVRFWDLLGSRSCVQELTTHREKAREGVLDVEFHPSLPFMASGGADGVVKLYASS
ncbi:WD40-repeat-containing domain protein [Gymnopilus junonius]|uniref:WD40-repeat-containing domain protein n=1 Tax=Gymnopilus junonius TaxID=109634 RepID=A0A9P5NAW3_GYMJU|nr:WD40-repeat-containing domain protein [Gymnopilus junonius]